MTNGLLLEIVAIVLAVLAGLVVFLGSPELTDDVKPLGIVAFALAFHFAAHRVP